MSELISRGMSYLREDGVGATTKKTVVWGLRRLGLMKSDAVHHRRVELSKHLDRLFGSTVRYGPFRGLKMATRSWWSSTIRAPILLGIYEQEILESLQNIPKHYTTFIDLGAADGYYAVGVLINNLFAKSYCFETSITSRQLIKENAELNGVGDRVEIHGHASPQFFNDIPATVRDRSVLFVDIEGAELDLLNKATFDAFKNSIIFIEMHEWFYRDGQQKARALRDNASVTHTITDITMTGRDLSKFEELRTMHDDDRWLICSEGRGQLMTWLRLDPIRG